MKRLSLCKSALLLLALVAGFVHVPKDLFGRPAASGTSSESNEQLRSLLNAPLPGHTVAAEQASFYRPDNLYQYIDGGADVYLLYDFQALLHQNLNDAAAELTADIYQMRTPEDAFGVYAAERSSSYKFVTIGIEGYRSQGILNFVQDRYYVKLTGSGAHTDLALDQLGRTISQRIGGIRTLPALLRKLPQDGLLPRSLQYIRKDPLGHSFLAPAYVATYGSAKQASKLFLSVATDPAAAKLRIDQLATNFKTTGESAGAPELGPNGIRAKNTFEGHLIARTQGRYVILLVNPLSNGPELLKAVAQNLR
jgi:hypothetical protein